MRVERTLLVVLLLPLGGVFACSVPSPGPFEGYGPNPMPDRAPVAGTSQTTRAACGGPLPTVGKNVVTDVNPPTWSWSSCSTTSGAYRIRLDGAVATPTSVTTFTPQSELQVGSHVLEVAELDDGTWSASNAFTVKIIAKPTAGTAGGEPDTSAPDGTNALPFSYPALNGATVPPTGLEIASPNGPLLPSDVIQGALGDCYLDASIGAVASASPTWLSTLVKPAVDAFGEPLVDANGYPLFSVSLNYPVNGKMTAWNYLADAKFPGQQGLAYDQLVWDGNVAKIGVPLLEKAYARLDQDTNYLNVVASGYKGDGYYAVGQGGWATTAFPALTGRDPIDIVRTDAPGALSGIAAGDGVAVVADINSGYFVPQSPLPSGATIAAQSGGSFVYTSADGKDTITLADIHYYSYLGAKGDSTVWRNPWGNVSGVDGVFTLPGADVVGIFNRFTKVDLK